MKKILALSASLLLVPRIILASSPLDSSGDSSLTKQWRLLSSQVELHLSQVQEQCQKQIQDLQQKLKETNLLLTEERKKSKELQTSNDSLTQQAAKDQEELCDLRQQIADNNEKSLSLITQLALNKFSPQKIKNEHIQKLEGQNKALEEKKEQIRQELLTSQDKISKLELALQGQQKKMREEQLIVQECQREKDDLAKVLDFNARRHEKEIADLKAELNASRSSVQDYEDRYQMTFQLANDYAEKFAAATSEVEKLKQKIDELTAQATEDQEKISDLEKKVADLPQKVEKSTQTSAVAEVPLLESSEVADSTDRSKTAQKSQQPADILSARMKRVKSQKLSEENKRLNEENTNLLKQIQKLQDQVSGVSQQEDMANLKDKHAQTIASLREQHLQDINNLNKNYNNTYSDLQKKLNEKDEALKQAKIEIQNLRIKIDQVQTRLTDRQNDILMLTRQNKAKPKTA